MKRKISESGKHIYEIKKESYDLGLLTALGYLAGSLNKISIPLIKDLLTTGKYTIKDVLSFSSPNGLNRLKKRFFAGIKEDSPYYSIGASLFNDRVSKHPEFHEFFAQWRFARLLTIDEDGLVAIDEEAVKRRNTAIVSDPTAVAYLDKLNEVCDLLNVVIPAHERLSSGNINTLRTVINYDKATCQFCPQELTEQAILRFLWYQPGMTLMERDRAFEEMSHKREIARADKEEEDIQKECGLSPSDLIPPAPKKEAAPKEK